MTARTAGRAALADPQATGQSTALTTSSPPPRRRRPLRTALFALAAVVVLGAATIGAYLFVMGHWFVGVAETADGDRVPPAGVPGRPSGIRETIAARSSGSPLIARTSGVSV